MTLGLIHDDRGLALGASLPRDSSPIILCLKEKITALSCNTCRLGNKSRGCTGSL